MNHTLSGLRLSVVNFARKEIQASNAYFNHTSFISDGGGQYLVQLLDVPANQYSLDLIFAQF